MLFPDQISDFLYLIQIIILYLNNPQTDMNLIINGVYCFISTYLFVRSWLRTWAPCYVILTETHLIFYKNYLIRNGLFALILKTSNKKFYDTFEKDWREISIIFMKFIMKNCLPVYFQEINNMCGVEKRPIKLDVLELNLTLKFNTKKI